MELPPLILASASPRRVQLLRELELDFEILPAHAGEQAPGHLSPREISLLNAYHKARKVAKEHPDYLVLGADTVVCVDNEVFGKPASLEEAHDMLARLQGRMHQVVTGVCLVHLRPHRQRLFAEVTHVTFRRLDRYAIHKYLSLVEVLDKAGAYAIQDHGDLIVERISGSYSNVMGLPLECLLQELEQWTETPP
jgi:septum formation protein